MGTELVKHIDIIKEMSALEVAWSDLSSVEEPEFKSTVESIETGEGVSGAYVASTLGTFATLTFIGGVIAAIFTESDLGVVLNIFAGSAVAFSPFGIETILREKGISPVGRLDTRVLRRKKYRSIAAREQLEYADAVKAYKQKHKKAEKAKKKLMLEAERILSANDGKMAFSNGKFSSTKAQPVLSQREKELLNEFTDHQLELES